MTVAWAILGYLKMLHPTLFSTVHYLYHKKKEKNDFVPKGIKKENTEQKRG